MTNLYKQPTNIDKILLPEQTIINRVKELGEIITNDYHGRDLLLVCILKGALVFSADLIRCMNLHTDLDFIQISSYGDRMESSGKIGFIRDIVTKIEERNILIVDDILDSGLTLSYVKDYLLAMNPSSIKTCVLLNKIDRRIKHINPDYVGFDISDNFVVGYGLDFKEQYRGLRYIATLKAELA